MRILVALVFSIVASHARADNYTMIPTHYTATVAFFEGKSWRTVTANALKVKVNTGEAWFCQALVKFEESYTKFDLGDTNKNFCTSKDGDGLPMYWNNTHLRKNIISHTFYQKDVQEGQYLWSVSDNGDVTFCYVTSGRDLGFTKLLCVDSPNK
jgi:hypothetical protein